jgi:Ulp1 family protease
MTATHMPETIQIDDDTPLHMPTPSEIHEAKLAGVFNKLRAYWPRERANRNLLDTNPGIGKIEKLLIEYGVLASGSSEALVTRRAKGSSDVKRSDVRKLVDGSWVNDACVNFLMTAVIKSRCKEDVRVVNTFFYDELEKGTDIRNWLVNFGIDFSSVTMTKILIPIHTGSHFFLAVMNAEKRQIIIMDSLREISTASHKAAFDNLRRMATGAWRDSTRTASWELIVNLDAPQQENTSDCGVFMCAYAMAEVENLSINTFKQSDMPVLRQRFAAYIVGF